MALGDACPVCGSSNATEIFRLDAVPVICNQLWDDASRASAAPVGDVRLVCCHDCAMVWNAEFDPDRMVYAPGYENALHFSPRFQAFSEELADGLAERFELFGKRVIEIGCGDGHMLDLLSKRGVASATGYDPSMAGTETPFTAREGVQIVPEYFRSDTIDAPFDAVICRHVLEHLDSPSVLLSDLRRAIGDRDVPVYFEVPNAGWMLRDNSMWDVIYEHVGYWTAPSITTAFRRAGFEPTSVSEGYGGQFLMIEARPGKAEPDYLASDIAGTLADAESFARATESVLRHWRKRLDALGGRAVIWGAGSKGITFGNALGPANRAISALVDLNPRKHGLLAPGIAIEVVSPEDLTALAPDLVLISNALYADEIARQVRDMGLDPAFEVVAG